jgi:hypothetical protein
MPHYGNITVVASSLGVTQEPIDFDVQTAGGDVVGHLESGKIAVTNNNITYTAEASNNVIGPGQTIAITVSHGGENIFDESYSNFEDGYFAPTLEMTHTDNTTGRINTTKIFHTNIYADVDIPKLVDFDFYPSGTVGIGGTITAEITASKDLSGSPVVVFGANDVSRSLVNVSGDADSWELQFTVIEGISGEISDIKVELETLGGRRNIIHFDISGSTYHGSDNDENVIDAVGGIITIDGERPTLESLDISGAR